MSANPDNVPVETRTADHVFDKYGRYYDLLYRDKDYVAEADYVVASLRNFDQNVRAVLEFGSGTGRHGRLLADRGLHVTGIERSESMVAAARRVVPASPGGPVLMFVAHLATVCELASSLIV